MNTLHTRIDDIFRPTPKERYLDYPSKVWDKVPLVDQVEEAEIVQEVRGKEFHITQGFYHIALERMLEMVGSDNYVRGNVVFDFAGVECHFDFVLIIYRAKNSCPDGESCEISDVVPVWWEFHTLKDGEEILNDFQFSKIRDLI